jgi:hypothetical protein
MRLFVEQFECLCGEFTAVCRVTEIPRSSNVAVVELSAIYRRHGYRCGWERSLRVQTRLLRQLYACVHEEPSPFCLEDSAHPRASLLMYTCLLFPFERHFCSLSLEAFAHPRWFSGSSPGWPHMRFLMNEIAVEQTFSIFHFPFVVTILPFINRIPEVCNSSECGAHYNTLCL